MSKHRAYGIVGLLLAGLLVLIISRRRKGEPMGGLLPSRTKQVEGKSRPPVIPQAFQVGPDQPEDTSRHRVSCSHVTLAMRSVVEPWRNHVGRHRPCSSSGLFLSPSRQARKGSVTRNRTGSLYA